ncbi:MAG: transglutaminase domain-containing protein [Oscillospiraceae bacterium]|nr:transglutaminase domain-containing protein [Oscillospiraceae bacterium]
MRYRRLTCLILALAALLCGCAGTHGPTAGGEVIGDAQVPQGLLGGNDTGTAGPGAASEDLGPYIAPEYADAVFHEELALGGDGVLIDLSGVEQGYVAVSAVSDKRLKFQVIKDEATYNYDLASDGAPSVFPLQSGDGEYRFRVMENVVDSKYAERFSTSVEIVLRDEFQPFIRPSDYVPYSRESACVRKAAELAQTAGSALGLVSAVYRFVCATVTYDAQKAATVQSGYLPDPDETMQTGKGICFDYASLAAAMLRSQGIPTKEVFGYVSPDGVYHAWNMFYTEETGWVTVSFEVRGESWNRMDLTFSANGADSRFIGDGSNYSDLYFY